MLSRHPALLPALAVLSGVLGVAHGDAASVVAVILLAAREPRRRRGVALLAVATALLAGAAGHTVAEKRRGRALAGLPAEGERVTGSWTGTVVRSPEPNLEGGRELRLRLDDRVGSPRLALRVAPSPPAPTAVLDGLRAGDRVRVWASVASPRPPGNPRAADPRRRLRSRGDHASGHVKSARLVEPLRPGSGPARRIDELRDRCRQRIAAIAGGDADVRALLEAMLLGERSRFPPEVRERLARTGGAHLIAVSGLHAGAVAGLLGLLLRRLRAPRLLAAATVVALLTLFALLVGGRPSVVRAVASASWVVAGRLHERDARPLHTLALVFAVLAVWNPFWLDDPGTALTFAATAGLLAALRPGRVRPLRLSCAAYLATAPFCAGVFGAVTPAALVFNLPAAPLGVGVVVAGYAALLLEPLGAPGALFGLATRLSARALLALAEVCVELGAAPLHVTPLPPPLSLAASATTVAALAARRPGLVTVVAALLQLLVHVGPPPPTGTGTAVHAIDVGQGQSVLVVGGGRATLVDTGGSRSPRFDPGARIVAPYVRHVHGPRLDALALSHGDLDHAGGAAGVVERLEIGELWLAAGWWNDPLQRGAVDRALGRGVALVLLRPGRSPARNVAVLAPDVGLSRGPGNARSLVLRFGEAPNRVLIPGDLEGDGERELLASPRSLAAELLVLAHHGSAGTSSPAFLDRVAPRQAVASCGHRNRFGHPADSVRRRLAERGVRLRRTDLDGRVLYTATPAGWRGAGFRRSRSAPG